VLNKEMDNQCKEFLKGREPLTCDEAPLTDEHEKVWIGLKKIVSQLTHELKEHLGQRQAEEYWGTKHKNTTSAIAWDVFNKAHSTLSRDRKTWLSKHSSGMCASSKMMVQMQQWEESKCPRCTEEEDSEHIWTCPAVVTEELLLQWEIVVQEKGNKFETSEDITSAIIECVKFWRWGSEDLIGGYTVAIQTTVDAQKQEHQLEPLGTKK
jgi:hypothetical protein